MSEELTHFDASGQAHMVDVSSKTETRRVAVASGRIRMQPETLRRIMNGTAEKGDVIGVARLAGIQGAKRTADLIPLCHPIALTRVAVEFTPLPTEHELLCQVTTETIGRTGVEMEALTAVSAALLTIYDMCKAIDRGMEIDAIHLESKVGGRSGLWQRQET